MDVVGFMWWEYHSSSVMLACLKALMGFVQAD